VRTLAAVQAVTAEVWAFADTWADYRDRGVHLNEVAPIIPRILGAPTWGLWWD
jgi:hypothetical protein